MNVLALTAERPSSAERPARRDMMRVARRSRVLLTPALAAALFAATPGWAGGDPPSPGNYTFPCAIKVVAAPAASGAHEFVVVVRDPSNNPVQNSRVVVDFSACGGDVRVALAQRPGIASDCPSRSVSQFTDANGRAVFRILGGGSGGAGFAHGGCAHLHADGVTLGILQVGVFDYDGSNGLTGADLSAFMNDYFTCAVPPAYCARSDFTFEASGCINQEIGASDLAHWLDAFFVDGGTFETPLCP